MLSPVERLGLTGASLDNRVCRAVHELSDATLARIATRLRDDAVANEIIYERGAMPEAVRIMLRPLLAMPQQLDYVEHVCLAINEALKRLPELYLEDPDVRRAVAITPEEDEWLRSSWTANHRLANPVYGRLDAVCDFTGASWQDSLRFLEPNLSGIGGIHFAPLAEQLVMRDVVPTLLTYDPELRIELPRDQRDLFVQVLIDHARAIGCERACVAFVEPKYVHEGPKEQSVLSQHVADRHGLDIVHVDPRELRVVGDEVRFQDKRVDLVYRDYELRDLIALERELGRPLSAMRQLFRQNRVISSLVGDFDHKSCWELLTDETLTERYFTTHQRRVFRRHILWTRVVRDRQTTLPQGEVSDLLDYARLYREQLVLKPNRGYGGTGVTMGAATSAADWDRLIDQAASLADDPVRSWVVQAAARLPVHEFPVVADDGQVFLEPFYAVLGFASTENGLGTLCRVSQKQVVNVAQHGGLAAMLVAYPPPDVRAPKRAKSTVTDASQALRRQVVELRHLDQTIGLLNWDEETMMPPAARAERGGQLATLEGLRHRLLTSSRLGDLIEEVAAQRAAGDDPRWADELPILGRQRRMAMALSNELVRAFAETKSRALGAWEVARQKNLYSEFAPALAAVLALVRERASALATGDGSYDALLDEHEPGLTKARLDPVLGNLQERLVPLVRAWAERSRVDGGRSRQPRVSETTQVEFCRRLLAGVGFDITRGRLDRSTHPFTLAAGPNDIRMTLRVDELNPSSAILATLHEGGHALYDQGLSAGDADSLLGEAPGMALHESQARLFENHVGRSLAFWERWCPLLASLAGESTNSIRPEVFHAAVNRVRPGANRVRSDEVTYHLHIVLRYELERALLAQEIPVDELPAIWNQRSAELLGVVPASDLDGVLQDVHWSAGMFGYFPSYTVGSLYAAQLAESYGGEWRIETEIEEGDLSVLLSWLREQVHEVGHRKSAEHIMRDTTGGELDAGAYFRHIESAQARLADAP